MIEPIMYFGIGFLVAALLGLLFVPLVHNRAVRLTMRRLEAATPLSIAEIRADKDQLRAEFAMSTRRLEMSVEQMKAKTTGAACRARQEDRRHQSAQERTRRKDRDDLRARGARQGAARPIARHRAGIRDQVGSLREAEQALADKQAELGEIACRTRRTLDHRPTASASNSRRCAPRSKRMKVSVADYERAVRETEARLARERAEAATAAARNCERRRAASSAASAARRPISNGSCSCRRPKPKSSAAASQDLEARLGDQGRLLAERDFQLDRLRSELEDRAQDRERSARASSNDDRQPQRVAVDKFRADIANFEAQLAAAIEERTRLQREIAAP